MLTGKEIIASYISGVNYLISKKVQVDELNVFPVPDGDTGTNMSMTARAAVAELTAAGDITASDALEIIASNMLRGARGNSGVILSILFRGFAQTIKGKSHLSTKDLSLGFKAGFEAAYKAVMKPTEGTLLTVARESATFLCEHEFENIPDAFAAYLKAAEESLARTPELLPVLKKAGVVDAGGAGYVALITGMNEVISGRTGFSFSDSEQSGAKTISAAGSSTEEITFTYCTEFIVVKNTNSPDSDALRAYLESCGDCAVLVDDGKIIKIHVHTDHPGNVLEEGLKFGSLINLKIENMREQHKAAATLDATRFETDTALPSRKKLTPVAPEKKFGFVAVASGSGLEALFNDLGVDVIVSGGQTNNPSAEDILEAVLATPAKTVFVLPNNKNIIMAAEQVISLATDRTVVVLQTRNVPQGISAVLAFEEEKSSAENAADMTTAFDKVSVGQVTFAARNSEIGDENSGKKIKKGDILGISGGKIVTVSKDIKSALLKTVKKTVHSETSFVTLFYGSDITDENAENLFAAVKEKVDSGIEVTLVNGGQPIYYFVVSAE